VEATVVDVAAAPATVADTAPRAIKTFPPDLEYRRV